MNDDKPYPFEIDEMINDFRKFVIYSFQCLGLPRPTRMQLYIADFLQEGHSRLVLQALRGIGKTTMTGCYVTWRLLRNPDERVLIVSQSGTHAEAIAIFIKKMINSIDILQHLIPRADQRDTTTVFEVNGSKTEVQPSVKALGITSQLQGNRASLLISDDVEGQQNSATEQLREKLINYTAEYEAILKTDANSQILVLGTPQSAESIYTRLREAGYVTRIFPARYPDDVSVYEGCLAPYLLDDMAKNPNIVGQSTDTRFSDEDLAIREARYGRSGFKLQFMLDTRLSDADRYPLRCSDLVVTDIGLNHAPLNINYSSLPQNRLEHIQNVGFNGDGFYKPSSISEEVAKYEGVYMGIDPSGKGKDALAYAIVSTLHGKLFLLDSDGLQGGYEQDNLIKLAMVAQKYSVNKIFIESNFGDSMFTALLKPVLFAIYPCSIEDIRHSTQKEVRVIDTLEPVLNQHRLIVDKGLVERDIRKALSGSGNISHSLFHQLTHITKDKGSLTHDDSIDVLAMVVNQWMRVLVQDPTTALERYQSKQLQNDIDKFLKRHSRNNYSIKNKLFGRLR